MLILPRRAVHLKYVEVYFKAASDAFMYFHLLSQHHLRPQRGFVSIEKSSRNAVSGGHLGDKEPDAPLGSWGRPKTELKAE